MENINYQGKDNKIYYRSRRGYSPRLSAVNPENYLEDFRKSCRDFFAGLDKKLLKMGAVKVYLKK